MKKVLFRGRCRRGIYPLVPRDWRSIKQAFNVTKISSSRWHSRLGHPSFSTVQPVPMSNKISSLDDSSIDSVCDSCQRAKSHQLSYPTCSSASNFPLELIFSDVWGPAATSVGRFSYYVRFIDDFSKYTWIYLIKKKSDVFDVFHNFQALVERQFGRKLSLFNLNGVASMKNSIPFQNYWNSSCILSSCSSTEWFSRTQTSSYSIGGYSSPRKCRDASKILG
jgi:hypothetical protein